MTKVDPVLVSALREQLARRPREARRVGWKVGRGDRERIGGKLAVGHLTSATLLQPGAVYAGAAGLHADAEIALELAEDERIDGYAAALELVDLGVQGDERIAAVGERLRPGDRIITGSVGQVAIAPGDAVVADFGSLGQVGVSIA